MTVFASVLAKMAPALPVVKFWHGFSKAAVIIDFDRFSQSLNLSFANNAGFPSKLVLKSIPKSIPRISLE